MLLQEITSELIDTRFVGRAGQGVVTASRLLGEAAIAGGKWVHAFPNFGPERMGAPVTAFTRIAEKKFTIKTQVYEPDLIVMIDPSLIKDDKYYEGIKPNGKILLNTITIPDNIIALKEKYEVYTVDGDGISRKFLGRTIANTVMLGAVLKVTGLVELDALLEALYQKFPKEIADKNAAAISAAFDEVKMI